MIHRLLPIARSVYAMTLQGSGLSTKVARSFDQNQLQLLHDKACLNQRNYYVDPATGFNVFTSDFHRKRGQCCGGGCRHCPFDHINVPAERLAQMKRMKEELET